MASSIKVDTKIFNAIYVGTSTLALNLTNCPWLTNIIKIIRPSLNTGINTRQSFNGAFNGATPGGAVTNLIPNLIYEFTAGDTSGWTLPDFSFYPVVTSVAAPTITSFSPSSVAKSGQVVITGTNFTGVTQVSINSAVVASFTIDSATQITATLTAANTTGKIRITHPQNGTAVSTNDLTVLVPGAKVPLYLVVGNSHAYGVEGSGDSTIGTAGHEAWENQALAKLNANSTTCAFKVFAYPGQTSDQITPYINGDVKDWVTANGSNYSSIIAVGQELYNQADVSGATVSSTYTSFVNMLNALKALPGVVDVYAFTGYPGNTQAREIIISGANKMLIEHRNELGIKKIYNTRTVPEAGTFTGGTVDASSFHLNEKGNGEIADFFIYGLGVSNNYIVDPRYTAPIVYNFKNASFDTAPPSGDATQDW